MENSLVLVIPERTILKKFKVLFTGYVFFWKIPLQSQYFLKPVIFTLEKVLEETSESSIFVRLSSIASKIRNLSHE